MADSTGLLVVGGLGAALLLRDKGATGSKSSTPVIGKVALTKSGGSIARPGQNLLPSSGGGSAAKPQSGIRPVNPFVQTGSGNWYTMAQASVDQRVTELQTALAKEYNALGTEAKKKGAQVLNDQLKLDPPLKGDEKWSTIVQRASAAAGIAACGALPGVQLAAPLCGIAAAYLGKKAHEWLEKRWGDIKTKAEEAWDDVKDAVKDAANDAYDATLGQIPGL